MAGIRSLFSSFLALIAGQNSASAAPGDAPEYAEAFTHAFEAGYNLKVDEAADGKPPNVVSTSFRTLDLGKLKITSGRIGACDPFVWLNPRDTPPPFTEPVPNGDFSVRLAIAVGGMSEGRIAFARVDFSTSPAVTWKMAVTQGQDVATLKTGEIFGYPVDAGTGSFYDPLAATALGATLKDNENAWQEWQERGEANGKAANYEPNFFLMMPAGDLNIAMFASGWGDGFYASYFGYGKDGHVVALITDFAIVDWPKVQR